MQAFPQARAELETARAEAIAAEFGGRAMDWDELDAALDADVDVEFQLNSGKAQESAMLALELERRLTKSEILQHYINVVFWGGNVYGIGAAAQTYFGKDPIELNLAEGLYLALVTLALAVTGGIALLAGCAGSTGYVETSTGVGVVPVGNTGGSNVSMFKRMPIAPELQRIIDGEAPPDAPG